MVKIMMPTMQKRSMHENVFWRTRMMVAFRTAWACFMAGLVSQLGNMHVQWTTFPIFSYVMAVTVVGESTFGKALQDSAGVLVGTIQGVGMAMLVLQLIGPEKITLGIAIVCISLSCLIIVYPQNTHVLSKRVALAHSAILYVTAYIKKGDLETVYFPLQLAGTTIVGATCGMLALLLPFPRLAIFQVQTQAKLLARITSERLRVMVDAFCTNDTKKGTSLTLQAKALAKIGSTADAEINATEGDMGWELPGFPGCSENLKHLIKGLSTLQKNLVGMELALQSDLDSPYKKWLHDMLKECLIYLADWACLALGHASADKQNLPCQMQLIIDEGKEALSSLDEDLSTARQKLAYVDSGEMEENMRVMLGEAHVGTGGLVEMVGESAKRSFQSLTAALFFLFNIKKFVEETKEILAGNSQAMGAHLPKSEQHHDRGKIDFCRATDRDPKVPKYSQSCSDNHVQIHIHTGVAAQDFASVIDNLKQSNCNDTRFLPQQQLEQKNSTTSSHHDVYTLRAKRFMMGLKANPQQLRTAFKMSLAMAMGAFMGSWFSKSKGYWADITLGLGFTGASQGGSFKLANLRAQGTVAGSIYGLILTLATKNFPFLRLVALIPWVVLTSFLRQSKLYGYAGAVSAFTGAVVILARTNKDSTDEDFTVIRIVEAFLGMACFIVVEMLVLPRRAASVVKTELISGLTDLRDFTAAALSAYSCSCCQKCCTTAVLDLKGKEKSLKNLLSLQRELIKEASEEPQFWFTPFPATIFSKLMDAQGRMMDLLHFSLCSFETILKVSEDANVSTDKLHGPFRSAMQILEEKIIPTLGFLVQALQAKIDGSEVSQGNVKNPVTKSREGDGVPGAVQKFVELKSLMINSASTLHASGNLNSQCSMLEMGPNKSKQFMEEFEKSFHGVVAQLMLHSYDTNDGTKEGGNMETVSNTVLLSLGALAFSLQKLLKETSELEKVIHELLQLENPWSLIDLCDTTKPSVSNSS